MKIRVPGSFILLSCLLAPPLVPQEKPDAKERPPAAPGTLDEMVAAALRSNPEVIQAEARARQAQAKLNEVRLRVTEDVISTFHEMEKQRRQIDLEAKRLESMRQMVQVGRAESGTVLAAELALVEAQTRLAQSQAHVRYVLGVGGDAGVDGSRGAPPERRQRPPVHSRFRDVLEKEVSVNFEGSSLRDVIDSLEQLSGGVIQPVFHDEKQASVRLSLSKVPLRSVLLALADMFDLCFVFRDYGVLATSRQQAASMLAPAIPGETPLRLD